MKQKYRLWQRRGGVYYAFDRETKKQISLGTNDKTEATRLLYARNEAAANPLLQRQMARAYLVAADLYMANWYSSGDWQLKQPMAMALPTVILKAGCLGLWAAGFLIRCVAG
jgi:hypothetical protein